MGTSTDNLNLFFSLWKDDCVPVPVGKIAIVIFVTRCTLQLEGKFC